ncbi:MAG: Gldg family protein [Proteobacteria bacterium]|nr:Gldg family protein [Pseudomonadota bacterium]
MGTTLTLIIGILGSLLALAGVILHSYLTSRVWIGTVLIIAGLVFLVILALLHYRRIQNLAGLRQTRFGANTLVFSLVILAILVLVNFLSVRHNLRKDFTREGLFTISPQTVKVLKELKTEVKITSFFKDKSPEQDKFHDLIQEYRRNSPLFKVVEVDPDQEPTIAQNYGVTQYGTIVVEAQGKSVKVKEISENELTNNLIKITRKEIKKICFLDGHAERSLEDKEKEGLSQLKDTLESVGYQTRKLILMEEERIPVECQLLVIAGPRKSLLPHEEEMIGQYLQDGGAGLILADPDSAPELARIAARFGIELGNGYIVDFVSRIFGGSLTMPLVTKYAIHEITANFRPATLYSLVRPVKKMNKPDYFVVELAQTGDQSFVTQQKFVSAEKMKFDPKKDTKGPITIAAVSTSRPKSVPDEDNPGKPEIGSRLAVFGDSDFASNSLFNFSGNSDLVLNVINWLSQEKDLIAIRPKGRAPSLVHLTPGQGRLIFLLSVVGLPLAILGFGLVIWWRRRRK